MTKSISQLVIDSYENAKEKGWHDPGMEKSVGDDIALMHSELSEALEDFRAGRKPAEVYYEYKSGGIVVSVSALEAAEMRERGDTTALKPCGIPIELADVLIRIFDFAGKHGIDLESAVEKKMAYNATRPHRHGGKKLLLVHGVALRVTTQRMEAIPPLLPGEKPCPSSRSRVSIPP